MYLIVVQNSSIIDNWLESTVISTKVHCLNFKLNLMFTKHARCLIRINPVRSNKIGKIEKLCYFFGSYKNFRKTIFPCGIFDST